MEMIVIDDIKEKYDNQFRDGLQTEKNEIEKILKEFIDKYSESIKLKDNISSRIKDVNRLCEKIQRNDYLVKWNKAYKKADVVKILKEEIHDLIGFKINCFFLQDEDSVIEKLITFLKEKGIECIDDTLPKNDIIFHKLFCKKKVSEGHLSFEIQVKSLMMDAWGEVDHDIKYKKTKYDSNQEFMESIMQSQQKIISGLESQLQGVYKHVNTLPDVKKELFYFITKNKLDESYQTNIGSYYKVFFDLFDSIMPDHTSVLDKFIGHALLESEFSKTELEKVEDIEYATQLINDFDELCWKCIVKLMEQLYEFEDETQLLCNIIRFINSKVEIAGVFDEDSNQVADAFGDDEIEGDCNKYSHIQTKLRDLLRKSVRETSYEKSR